ncbi:MAG: hypothetical protein AAGK98_05150 [Pseudomonadota bacterium]
MMKLSILAATTCLLLSAAGASAQEIKAAVPSADQGSYNPQLTAKEAVLTNWKLAISGLRAGKFVSDNVARAEGVEYPKLAAQAEFAAETMLLRYASSYWLFAMDETLDPVDGAVLLAAMAASRMPCETACDAATEALTTAFGSASAVLEEAAQAAELAAEARKGISDVEALAELLSDMATYLDSPAWHSDLSLTAAGMDGKEVSARVVGTLAVWRNIEPFVGMRSAEIDTAVNAASDRLLRDVRRNTRRKEVLAPDSAEIETIRASAAQVAHELRRAAGLFQQG